MNKQQTKSMMLRMGVKVCLAVVLAVTLSDSTVNAACFDESEQLPELTLPDGTPGQNHRGIVATTQSNGTVYVMTGEYRATGGHDYEVFHSTWSGSAGYTDSWATFALHDGSDIRQIAITTVGSDRYVVAWEATGRSLHYIRYNTGTPDYSISDPERKLFDDFEVPMVDLPEYGGLLVAYPWMHCIQLLRVVKSASGTFSHTIGELSGLTGECTSIPPAAGEITRPRAMAKVGTRLYILDDETYGESNGTLTVVSLATSPVVVLATYSTPTVGPYWTAALWADRYFMHAIEMGGGQDFLVISSKTSVAEIVIGTPTVASYMQVTNVVHTDQGNFAGAASFFDTADSGPHTVVFFNTSESDTALVRDFTECDQGNFRESKAPEPSSAPPSRAPNICMGDDPWLAHMRLSHAGSIYGLVGSSSLDDQVYLLLGTTTGPAQAAYYLYVAQWDVSQTFSYVTGAYWQGANFAAFTMTRVNGQNYSVVWDAYYGSMVYHPVGHSESTFWPVDTFAGKPGSGWNGSSLTVGRGKITLVNDKDRGQVIMVDELMSCVRAFNAQDQRVTSVAGLPCVSQQTNASAPVIRPQTAAIARNTLYVICDRFGSLGLTAIALDMGTYRTIPVTLYDVQSSSNEWKQMTAWGPPLPSQTDPAYSDGLLLSSGNEVIEFYFSNADGSASASPRVNNAVTPDGTAVTIAGLYSRYTNENSWTPRLVGFLNSSTVQIVRSLDYCWFHGSSEPATSGSGVPMTFNPLPTSITGTGAPTLDPSDLPPLPTPTSPLHSLAPHTDTVSSAASSIADPPTATVTTVVNSSPATSETQHSTDTQQSSSDIQMSTESLDAPSGSSPKDDASTPATTTSDPQETSTPLPVVHSRDDQSGAAADDNSASSDGTIIGVAVAAVLILAIGLFVLAFVLLKKRKKAQDQEPDEEIRPYKPNRSARGREGAPDGFTDIGDVVIDVGLEDDGLGTPQSRHASAFDIELQDHHTSPTIEVGIDDFSDTDAVGMATMNSTSNGTIRKEMRTQDLLTVESVKGGHGAPNARASPKSPRTPRSPATVTPENMPTVKLTSATVDLNATVASDLAGSQRSGARTRTSNTEDNETFFRAQQMIKDNRFTKLRLIGRGAFGSVFNCILDDGQVVALKEMLLPEDAASNLQSITTEVDLVSELSHPNVVRYFGCRFEREENKMLLFMELAAGGSLATVCRQAQKTMSEQIAQRYFRQVLEALSYIHSRGVVHRDLKCDNVLLSQDGQCKLGDFGTSRVMQNTTQGNTAMANTMVGTPLFMAPEMILEQADEDGVLGYTKKADIWSFGILCLEFMNRGNPPWPSFSNQGAALFHIASEKGKPIIPDGVSDEFRDFIGRCCERDPAKRATAAELLQHSWFDELVLAS